MATTLHQYQLCEARLNSALRSYYALEPSNPRREQLARRIIDLTKRLKQLAQQLA